MPRRGLGARCRPYLAAVLGLVCLIQGIFIAERQYLSDDLAAAFGAASPGCGGSEARPARIVDGATAVGNATASPSPRPGVTGVNELDTLNNELQSRNSEIEALKRSRNNELDILNSEIDALKRDATEKQEAHAEAVKEYAASIDTLNSELESSNSNLEGGGTAGWRPAGSDGWREQWAHAYSSLGVRSTGPDDGLVLSGADSLRDETLAGLASMERRYEEADALPDFRARGLGWVEDRLGMVLAVVVVGGSGKDAAPRPDGDGGRVSVYVVDVVGNRTRCGPGDGGPATHPPLTMWVRASPAADASGAASGPSGSGEASAEMFAGTALPHEFGNGDPRCAWRYDFEPRTAGAYSVHVKLLTYNGFADFDPERCNANVQGLRRVPGVDGDGIEPLEEANRRRVAELAIRNNWTHTRGVSGFKMYSPNDACCEACTRARGCRAWTTPGSRHYDNCQLFFDRVEDDLDFADGRTGHYLGRGRSYTFTKQTFGYVERRRRLQERRLAVAPDDIKKPWGPDMFKNAAHGTSRSESTAYFLGCGWSSLMSFESPCHDPSDDMVHGSGVRVQVGSPPPPGPAPPGEERPEGAERRPCTLEDERVSNSFAGRWVQYPFPDDETCSALVQDRKTKADFRDFRAEYLDDEPPLCWHRDDISRHANTCVEPGCQWVLNHRWKTSLRKQDRWYGRWEQYGCNVMDVSTADLQKCVDERRISKIEVRGASIAEILDGYMIQRTHGIKFVKEGGNTLTAILDTLKFPHLLWHNSVARQRSLFEDDAQFPPVPPTVEHYWVSGFYITSEREPHTHVDRSLQFTRLAEEILGERGYRPINVLGPTAAFAYDTDGQADGLHISGPPAKVAVQKFFHHLCRDVLA
mmetsp:Transcript_17714/g.41353  ORF Transcript_17714/g.41353 Transcript_17714/m.41353 type:complete len:868 (+) Transcript_17714:185-2788(+)